MALHSLETLGSNHVIHSFEYADSTAREADTSLTANDVKKVALQLDDNTYWTLVDTTPTWVSFAGTGAVPGGADTQVQFNDGSTFGGANINYNKATDDVTFSGDVVMDDNSVTGVDAITFTDTAGTIAGIQNQNLLDKTATETITGGYTMNDLKLGGELDAAANSIGFTAQSATGDGTTTIDWGNGNKFNFTFGAFNETFTFTAPAKPGNFVLKLVQDGTGSRTATWPATVKWPAGTAPTLTTTGSAIDIVSFYWDGVSYYGNSSLAFA